MDNLTRIFATKNEFVQYNNELINSGNYLSVDGAMPESFPVIAVEVWKSYSGYTDVCWRFVYPDDARQLIKVEENA